MTNDEFIRHFLTNFWRIFTAKFVKIRQKRKKKKKKGKKGEKKGKFLKISQSSSKFVNIRQKFVKIRQDFVKIRQKLRHEIGFYSDE